MYGGGSRGVSTAEAWHTTSIALILVGGATAVGVLPGFTRAGWAAIGPGASLPGLLITLALAAVWQYQRIRAEAAGVARPAGFGTAALVAAAILVVGRIAVIYAGPFLIFAVGLLVAGWTQRNRFLVIWALVAGGIGVLEGFYGITNRLRTPLWQPWLHPAIYLAIALATVLAGILTWRREAHA